MQRCRYGKEAYDFYFSYISNNIRPNSANFKRLVGKLPYYGQLGSLTNTTKKQAGVFFALRPARKNRL